MFKTLQLGRSADAIDLYIQVRNSCIVGSIRLEAIDDDDYKTSAFRKHPKTMTRWKFKQNIINIATQNVLSTY